MTGALINRRIIVTRAAEQAGELVALLRAAGAEPIVCPLIATVPPHNSAPLDIALAQLPAYDWLIVTSANAVAALVERAAVYGFELSALRPQHVAAVGPATAQALTAAGLLPNIVPTEHSAAGLLATVGMIEGQRVLIPQADIARPDLAAGLRARGAEVTAITAYCTVPGAGVDAALAALRAGIDAIIFTSPSTVRALYQGLAERGIDRHSAEAMLDGIVIACIGPTTAAAVLRADVLAEPHTAAGMVDALLRRFSTSGTPH